MNKFKVLYIYEKRIPLKLRHLVIKELKRRRFSFKLMRYDFSIKKQIQLFKWADAVFFGPGRKLNIKVINSAKNVKIFQLWSSGYDKFDVKSSTKNNIPVCTNGSQNNIAVAEHAVLLMMALNKKLIHFNKITVEGKWKNNSHGVDLYEMYGKNLGIIGLGKIGKRVAEICKSFGMNIYYYDIKKADTKIEKKLGIKYLDKNKIFRKSDILTLHLHLNSKTKNFINKNNIKKLKKNTSIINVSRAELIEKNALLKALRKKLIRGAGLDVHYEEPSKYNDPINTLENVVVTPHTAGSTYDTYNRVIDNCLSNIQNALNKKKIMWQIN